MARLSLLLALSIFLPACADQREEPPVASSLVREIPTENAQKSAQLIQDANLKCQGKCPENVGLYLASRPNSVLTCTAFLIAPDVVATNSHCLPKVIKDLPDLCPSTIQILFPKANNFGEEKVACKSLLGFSERPNAISPDLALIQLEKSLSRAPLPLSRAGIAATEHTSWKVNPGKGASGEIVQQTCQLVEKNYRLPLFENRFSKIFVTGDCPSLPGNSGAPLINKEGFAVGIFQAELPFSEMQIKAWSKHLLPGETFATLAMGTNLFCLMTNSRFEWNSTCDPIEEDSIQRPRISQFPLDSDKEKILATLDQEIFTWESVVQQKTLEAEERLIPKCLKKTFQEREFSTPILQRKIFFNRYMQVFPKLERLGEEKTTYSILETESGWQLLSPQKDAREILFCEHNPIEP
jgi:hypothetical protein